MHGIMGITGQVGAVAEALLLGFTAFAVTEARLCLPSGLP